MLTKRWPKILVLAIGIILIQSKFTDADFIVKKFLNDNLFKATTLDFSNRQTANELPTSTLFNITGIMSGGFETASARIKKEGEMQFNYKISPQFTNSSILCEQLRISIYNRQLQQLYSGELVSLNLLSKVEDNHYDLIFIISLDTDVGKNKRCDFNLIIETIDSNNNLKKGFWDEEILQNFISS